MIIKLAYTNHYAYEEDLAAARQNGRLFTFEIDVADVTPPVAVRAQDNRWTLLDGTLRVLKSRTRRRASFVTKPDVMLKEVTSNGETLKLKDALARWFFARASWINTTWKGEIEKSTLDVLYDSTSPTNTVSYPGDVVTVISSDNDFEKVVTTGDFTPEKFDQMLMMQQVTIEFETTRSFAV